MTLNTNSLDFTIVENAERLGGRNSKGALLSICYGYTIISTYLATQTMDKEHYCPNLITPLTRLLEAPGPGAAIARSILNLYKA